MKPTRRFSVPPRPGNKSQPVTSSRTDGLTADVRQFKRTYVVERNLLQKFRSADSETYRPAKSLDGESNYVGLEEKQKKNVWFEIYNKLKGMQPVPPVRFIRLLFRCLRGTSLAIPTVQQLASANSVKFVTDFLQASPDSVRIELVSQTQSIRPTIVLQQRQSGADLPLAVYYAITDPRADLTPLFKYCTARSTSELVKRHNVNLTNCPKLDQLAKDCEILAAMDYSLFPDLYDQIWGQLIPSGFRVLAEQALASALNLES